MQVAAACRLLEGQMRALQEAGERDRSIAMNAVRATSVVRTYVAASHDWLRGLLAC